MGSTQQGLQYSSYSDTIIAGTYDDGATHISFSSEQTGTGIVTLHVTTGSHGVVGSYDFNAGAVELTGEPVAFTKEELDAFVALQGEIGDARPEKQTQVEAALDGFAGVMTKAVPGLVWQDIKVTATRGWVDINPGNYCRTLYGTSCSPYKMTGVNSPSCKGRCGAGCGSARTGSYNRWTMDCAEHDYMIGPFSDTVDDFTFAANQWSNGGGEFCASNCKCNDGC